MADSEKPDEEIIAPTGFVEITAAPLEATTNDLANLLNSTGIAVIFLNAKFRVRHFTPDVTDLFELIETDIGRPVTDLAQKFTDDQLLSDARSVLQHRVPVEREILGHGGRWYLRRTLPYCTAENRIEGVVMTFLDITQRRRGELALVEAEARRKLAEEQLKSAIASAERAHQLAEDANRAKDEFIAVVSHELRTPLNTIRLWTRMLGNETLPAKDRLDGVQMINRAAIAQQQVIDDLFDLSRIASGKLKLSLRKAVLSNVIKSAVDAVDPAASARGLHLKTELGPNLGMVRADPGRLQQVIWNLLSNAVKFTPQGGEVKVRATREDAVVTIEISDTGVGIKREFLPHVFDRFRQAEGGTTPVHGGLGLGLAIAKQIVDLHGGSICARSDGPGKGSTFRIELPLPATAGLDDTGEHRRPGSDVSLTDVERHRPAG